MTPPTVVEIIVKYLDMTRAPSASVSVSENALRVGDGRAGDTDVGVVIVIASGVVVVVVFGAEAS
eukprot:CAMPEP_0202071786 /NCGR_PEP_ID=MMETSP0964-20121228/2018_1 /ASSEMBLY_ACC=CAM_ASM_000500 /TAXON_ID=4773 /ORGANISM="Schizochytrium aggregatum, Strain ATCC28209" /LENGTH=64 /DNA_ID=CAMNT_0048638785 /DNA_START=585 /DNA_END=777 /DNA_ORIENTATION=-